MAAREQANSVRRSGFLIRLLARGHFSGREAGRPRRQSAQGPQHSYCTEVGSFKFIAPRCLDEEAPADQRRGVHVGTLERPPKVYCDGSEYDVLNFASGGCWPRRIRVWNGQDFRGDGFNPRFERFHVYDIVETSESASHDDPSRFAELSRPSGSVVTLLGMSECGKRVAVHVYGVRHYFYMAKAEVDSACGITTEAELVRAMVDCAHSSALSAALGNGNGGKQSGGSGGDGGAESTCLRTASKWRPCATRRCTTLDLSQLSTIEYLPPAAAWEGSSATTFTRRLQNSRGAWT